MLNCKFSTPFRSTDGKLVEKLYSKYSNVYEVMRDEKASFDKRMETLIDIFSLDGLLPKNVKGIGVTKDLAKLSVDFMNERTKEIQDNNLKIAKEKVDELDNGVFSVVVFS